MTLKDKRTIEWHFRNYQANLSASLDYVRNIAESGMVRGYDKISVDGGLFCNPTMQKAFMLEDRSKPYRWAKVVENTVNTYRWESQYCMINQLFFENKPRVTVIDSCCCGAESTFHYWLNKVLETAYMWALDFDLL